MEFACKRILCLCVAGMINSLLAMSPVVEKSALENTFDVSVSPKTTSFEAIAKEFETKVKNIPGVKIIDFLLLSRAKAAVIKTGEMFLKKSTSEKLLAERMNQFLNATKYGVDAKGLYMSARHLAGDSRSVEGTLYFIGSYAFCGDSSALCALSESVSTYGTDSAEHQRLRDELFVLGHNGQTTYEEYKRSLPAYEEAIAALFGGIFPTPKK